MFPDIGQDSDCSISEFWISGQSFIEISCQNSRARDDIDMKFGPVNLTRVTKQCQENLITMSCQKTVTSLPFFQFKANLEQSRSWIPGA